MHIEEILIVCHDKVCFGISTALIGQILRIPELTPLCLSPKEVRGVCAVGGNIRTAVDMNIALGMAPVDIFSSKGRILSFLDPYNSSALVVSEVVVSVMVDQDRIEYVNNPDDPIVAIYHHGEELIQILDISQILKKLHTEEVEKHEISEKSEKVGSVNEKNSSTERYLFFRMGEEMYALGIENLREILGAHHPLTQLSGANTEIAGMMPLRDELLVVADLRIYCGFEPFKSDKNRILVAETKENTIGLIVDEIVDIKECSEELVDRFTQIGNGERVVGVIHDPKYLVSLLGERIVEEIVNRNNAVLITSDEKREMEITDTVMEAVVFKLGNEEYALPIEEVAEIIDAIPITPVSFTPTIVEGVINIRGQIVTIGSLHRYLGLSLKGGSDQKIIICHTPKGQMGFFVDSVSDVMQVRSDEILDDVNNGVLFSKVLRFNEGKRLVLLFDLAALYREERVV